MIWRKVVDTAVKRSEFYQADYAHRDSLDGADNTDEGVGELMPESKCERQYA